MKRRVKKKRDTRWWNDELKRMRRSKDTHWDAWAPIEIARELAYAWERSNGTR